MFKALSKRSPGHADSTPLSAPQTNIDKTFALLLQIPLATSFAAPPLAYLKLQISQYQIECKQRQKGRHCRKASKTAAGEQLACT